MLSRHLRPPVAGNNAANPDLERLVDRIRRLAGHHGYDREALISPMLKRLMPAKRLSGDPIAERVALNDRLKAAGLNDKAVAYLIGSVEIELDFAHLRLT